METIVIAVHIIVAVVMIGLILLQQGKGAEMGASFGSGSSQTLFGPQGAGTVFSRATAIFTAIFFVTSLTLAVIAKDNVGGASDKDIPDAALLEQQDAATAADADIPQAPIQEQQESDIPE